MIQFILDTDLTGRIDITERVASYRLESQIPGGWWEARLEMNAPKRDLWRLVGGWAGGKLEAWGAGQTLWRGDLARLRLRGLQMRVEAIGQVQHLADEELWRVFSDPRYRLWAPDDETTDGLSADNNNRVYCSAASTVEYIDGDAVACTYPESNAELGAGIVRIEAHVEVTISSGSWVVALQADGSTVWSTTSDTETDVAITVSDASEMTWVLTKNGAGTGEATAILTNVVVRTLYPVTTSDIVESILDNSNLDLERKYISATDQEVSRAVYQGGMNTSLTALHDMSALGNGSEPFVFSIYDRQVVFGAWSDDPDWMITPDFLDRIELEWDREDVFNAVRARLPNGWVSDWYTNDNSIEKYGRRERTLDVPKTTQAEARTLAQIFLADNAWPVPAMRLEAGAHVKRPDGSIWPGFFIRAGDIVTLRDVVPYRDIDVQVTRVRISEREVRLTPRSRTDRLEVLLAELEQRRTQQNMVTTDSLATTDAKATAAIAGGASGDMLKSIYDSNANGVVDDSEALGGIPAATYLTRQKYIYLFDAGSDLRGLYAASASGLDNASAAADTGDVVWIPPVTIGDDHTLAAGVHYIGISRWASRLTGEITLSAETTLECCTVERTANDSNDLRGIIGPGNGVARVSGCTVDVQQDGTGDAYGIYADSDTDEVSIYVNDCVVNAQSGSGNGYAYYAMLAEINVTGGRATGSTAPVGVE
jgi:hypothetical protein